MAFGLNAQGIFVNPQMYNASVLDSIRIINSGKTLTFWYDVSVDSFKVYSPTSTPISLSGITVSEIDPIYIADPAFSITAQHLTDLGNLSGINSGDQTITLTGDATGTGTGSFAVTVVDDLHNHVYSNIDAFTEANLYTLLSDVTQFYEVGDDISADESDPIFVAEEGNIAKLDEAEVFSQIITFSNGVTLTGIADPAHSAGKLWYSTDTEALSFYNAEADVTMQLGQEHWIPVRNNSGFDIPDFTPVYQTGALGNRATIALAKADNVSTAKVIGLTTHAIENNTDGYVTVIGSINGVDTDGSPYTETWIDAEAIYLSATTAGDMTDTAPIGNNYVVHLGHVLDATNNGSFLVILENGLAYPSVAVDNRVTTFDGTTGKRIQDSGITISEVLLESELSAQETDPVYITDPAFSITAGHITILGNTSGTNTGDQTITLTGDATGTGTGSFAVTVVDDLHSHIYSNIDPFTEANLYTLLSDVTQFYEVGDDISADESDPNVDSEGEIETILGIAFGISKTATDDFILVGDGIDFESVAMSGEATINNGVITIASSIHDDEYIELTDAFVGDVTGTYGATVVGNDSHDHATSITGTSGGISDADYGDVTITGGVWEVENDSHSHTGLSPALEIFDGVTSISTTPNALIFLGTDFVVTDGVPDDIDISIQDGALNDEYIELADAFGGDVSGTYGAIVVTDDSHAHIYSNIDAFTEANLYTLLSDVTQFYEVGDDISADESDPNVDTEGEIEAILGIAFGTSKVATDDFILVGDGVDFESVAMSGDVSINNGVMTVVDDSHAHIYSNIDAFTEANLYSILSDVTQFYEVGDDISADESDPNVDTANEIEAILTGDDIDFGIGDVTATLGTFDLVNVGAGTIGSWSMAIDDTDGGLPLRVETSVAGGALSVSMLSDVQEWRIGFDIQEDFVIIDQTDNLTAYEILNGGSAHNLYNQDGSLTVDIRSETDDAILILHSNVDGLGGENNYIQFWDNGTQYWTMLKNSSNNFRLYDQVAGESFLEATSNAGLRISPINDALTLFSGAVGVDPTVTWDGESWDLVMTWQEDERYLSLNNHFQVSRSSADIKSDGGTGSAFLTLDGGGGAGDTLRFRWQVAGTDQLLFDYGNSGNTFRFHDNPNNRDIWTYDQEDGIFAVEIPMTVESNYVLEGYTTGKSVFRSIQLSIVKGAGTNINVSSVTTNNRVYNEVSLTNGTNIGKSGSSGSFSLNAGGTVLTINPTETVVKLIAPQVILSDVNNSDGKTYHGFVEEASGNIELQLFPSGSSNASDYTAVFQAGDLYYINIQFVTSS